MNIDTLVVSEPVYGLLLLLADLLIKGVLVLICAKLLTSFLAKSAAAARHLIWATALLIILLLPVINAVLPQVNLPILTVPFQVESNEQIATHDQGAMSDQNTGNDQVISSELDQQSNAATEYFEANDPRTAHAFSIPRSESPRLNTEEGVTSSEYASADASSKQSIAPAVVASQSFWQAYIDSLLDMHWTLWLVGIWGLGVGAIVAWSLTGLTGAWWITQRAQLVDDQSWIDLSEELGDRLMIYRPVRLLMSSGIASPMTWGIWRPVVLLPIDADDWSAERRRYVLLHEMAHIKRWDTLTLFGAQLSCALNWFNPLVWRGLHSMRIEQEKACDDLVLSHGMKPSAYAHHLLDIA